MASAPLARSKVSYERQQGLEEKTIDEVSQKGALPIKIDVPQIGKAYRFSKLLLAEAEGGHLSVGYNAIFKGKLGTFATIFIIIAAVIFAIGYLRKRR